MKRIIISALFVLLASAAGAREVVNINRDWKFFYGSEISSDNAVRVNIPHMWNNDALGGKKDYLRGIGNYLKDIEIPASWKGRRVFVKCHGANSIASVMINGKYVGEHRGGYTAFAFEITDYVNFGRTNYLWIMVNNSPQMDVMPIAGDAAQYGGLFRDVELIVTGKEAVTLADNGSDGVYVKQTAVSKQKAEGEIVVKVDGMSSANVTARFEIKDEEGKVVASGSSPVTLSGRAMNSVYMPFSVENPTLWQGVRNPYMYKVAVSIVNGGKEVDRVEVGTGFRRVEVTADKKFLLNGEPYRVRGVVVTQDRAMVGSAITRYQVQEDFELIRQMGANAVRIAGVCHNPEFYDLCDRHGILVWSDFPLVGATYLTDKSYIESNAFRDNGTMQAREIISQQYNRPSVFAWGLFSEMSFRGDNPVRYIKELNMLAKREDPSRLTGAASNEDGDMNFVSDLILWNQNLGWKEGLPADADLWAKQLKSRWSKLRSGISYSAGASIYHQEEETVRPVMNGNWHPEKWQTHLHEEYFNRFGSDKFFWGLFVGNMFDYGAPARTWGEGNGLNDCGLVTFDRKYCKDAYYLYKANWNSETPFVYIAERRWDVRGNRRQNIRVYSNCAEVELVVNGISYGELEPFNGIFTWKDVELEPGRNTLEAKSEGITDKVIITVAE